MVRAERTSRCLRSPRAVLAGAGHADWIRAFYGPARARGEDSASPPRRGRRPRTRSTLRSRTCAGSAASTAIEGGFGDPRGELSTVTRCGLALGAHAGVFDVKRPPHFARPAEIGTPDMSFAWSSDDWAVYL